MVKRMKAAMEKSRLAHETAVQQASLKLKSIQRNRREEQGDKEVGQATLRNLKVGAEKSRMVGARSPESKKAKRDLPDAEDRVWILSTLVKLHTTELERLGEEEVATKT